MARPEPCPLCGIEAEAWDLPDRDGVGFECPACGLFYVGTHTLRGDPPSNHPDLVRPSGIQTRAKALDRFHKLVGAEKSPEGGGRHRHSGRHLEAQAHQSSQVKSLVPGMGSVFQKSQRDHVVRCGRFPFAGD